MKPDFLEQAVQFRKVAEVLPPPGVQPPWYALSRLGRFARAYPWFIAIVVLPTLLATLYFGLIAADLYVSETRFVVRTAAQPQGSTSLGALLQSVGFARSTDDTFSVHDFILSRDIVAELREKHELEVILSRPEGDFLHRFPPFWADPTFEQLYRTYKSFVSVMFDTSTGISTLEVRGLRPEDAHRLASVILAASEGLINRMNDRAHSDTVRAAEADVKRMEQRVVAAQATITQYRLKTRDLDPRAQATTSYTLLGQLSLQLANAQAQLRQVEIASPNSPQIASLREGVNAIRAELARENARLTGQSGSTATQLSGYESLLLEQEFATKALASANASLEAARQTALRQQLYLEQIVKPLVPDYPIYPLRLLNILLVLVVSLLVYGIAWLVSASVREHSHL